MAVKLNPKFCFVFYLHVVLLFCFSGISFAQRVNPSHMQQWDDRIMISLANHRTPEKTRFMHFISNTCIYGNIAVPASLLMAGSVRNDQQMRQNALFVASSTALSYGLTILIKQVVKRQRPFIQNIHITPIYRAQGLSFPSGHTATCFATATALSMAYPKWYVIAPSFLWAGTIGYSRMYLGVHYPTDVGIGTVLGAGSALSMSFLKK